MNRRLIGDIGVRTWEPVEIQDPAAPPVLLLHGIGGNADTFASLGRLLAEGGRRAVAWDAPGYGASVDPRPGAVDGPDSPASYVSLVADLLTTLDEPRAHLVGVSWGGVIATHLAVRRPDLVASLTLVDSTRGSGTDPDKAAAMRGRVTELAELGGRVFASRRAPRLLSAYADPVVAADVADQMSAVRLPGYGGAAEMMAQSDTGPLLSAIRVPTLVVVGEEDRVTGVPEARLLAREIPGAQFSMLARAGHAAVQERPAELATELLAFLADQHTSDGVLR